MKDIETKPTKLLVTAIVLYAGFILFLLYFIMTTNGVKHSVNFIQVAEMKELEPGRWRVMLDTVIPVFSEKAVGSVKLIVEDENYFAEFESVQVKDQKTWIQVKVPLLSEENVSRKKVFAKLYHQESSQEKLYENLFTLKKK